LRRQGAWAFVDQVLSSGTNFVPSLLMARLLVPHDYGTFSLAYLAWFGALAIVVSGLMQPYTLASSAHQGEAWRDITRDASGAVVIAGSVCSVVFIAVAVIAGATSTLGLSFLAIALLAPALALQEFWRVASFAASQAKTAAANDGYWAIGQIVAFGILLLTKHPTAPQCLLAWGAGAWLAAGLGVHQLSVMPRVNLAAVRWARKWGRIGAWFTLAGTSFSLSMLIVAVIIGADFDRTAVGLFRIVQLLFGPVQLFTVAAGAVFMPHLVRVIKATAANALRLVVLFSVLLASLFTVYGLVLLVSAHFVLVTFFGRAYAGAGALVLPMLISYAIDGASSGADAHLRVRELGGRIATVQVAASVARVSGVAVLASFYGLRGAVWGLVVGSAVVAVAYWTQVLITSRRTADRLVGDNLGVLVAHGDESIGSPEIVRPSAHSSMKVTSDNRPSAHSSEGSYARTTASSRPHGARRATRGSLIWTFVSVVWAVAAASAVLYAGTRIAVLVALLPAVALAAARLLPLALERRALGLILTWAGLISPFIIIQQRTAENIQTSLVTPLNMFQGVAPIVFLVAVWLVFRRRVLPFRGAELALVGFAGVCLFSAVWSVNPLATALRAAQLVAIYLLLILLVRQLGPPSAVVRHLVGAVYVAIVGALLGIVVDRRDALSPGGTYDSVRRVFVRTPAALQEVAPYIHPDLLAWLAAVALLSLLAGVGPRWSQSASRRIAMGGASFAVLLLTGVRSALVLLALGLLLLAVLDARSRWRVLGLVIAAVVVVMLIPPLQSVIAEHLRRGQDAQSFGTLTGRTTTWHNALLEWGQRPVTGYGYYAGHRFSAFVASRGLSNLDSMYVETLVDVGLVGLSALVLFIVVGLQRMVRSARSRTRSLGLAVTLAALAGAAVNPSLQTPGVTLIVAAVLLLTPWAPTVNSEPTFAPIRRVETLERKASESQARTT
jgi:O-antigen/teichoic acid export membrane protein/O-antigen ligase